jgi:hypothetical protein
MEVLVVNACPQTGPSRRGELGNHLLNRDINGSPDSGRSWSESITRLEEHSLLGKLSST